ncbi:fibronectin type III domain-containing protein [Lactobacillus salivarius]|uniref:fibronectin type III domain-containing protein n=1 Tax=Ligilactobacillus salivarius TaxID=1624 RepID=UPI00136FB201|nr:fibronectin type III domain-containing protein [Ligilactobacillus salivarius]MYU49827.1 fibronectin type III domain-containing protein [Ligilactobacillus salivarius]
MKYYIYQGLSDSGELTKIAEVTDVKTYTVTGLEANTKYRFAVSTYNGLRESAKSNIITVTTAQISVQSITLAISKTSFEVGETTTITATLGGKTSNMLTIQVYEALVSVSNLTSSNVTANSVTLSWT